MKKYIRRILIGIFSIFAIIFFVLVALNISCDRCLHFRIFDEKVGNLYTNGEFVYNRCLFKFICLKIDEISDPKTLEYLGYQTYKDKNNIYRTETSVITSADFAIMKVIDVDNVYDKEVDISSFEYVGGYYFKDKNYVYIICFSLMKGAYYCDESRFDADSFEYLSDNYTMDKNGVYFYSQLVSQLVGLADPMTFRVLKNDNEEDTFQSSVTRYAKDVHHVYWNGSVIEGADSTTFQVFKDHFEKDELEFPIWMYAKDVHHVYWNGSVIEGVDPDSFRRVKSDVPFQFEDDLYYYTAGYPWDFEGPPYTTLYRAAKSAVKANAFDHEILLPKPLHP